MSGTIIPPLSAERTCPSRKATIVLVVAVLVLHYALAVTSYRQKSATFDEVVHITAGYSYWRFNDYRLHPDNGNLTQRWAALPLVLSDGISFPDRSQPAWRISDVWQLSEQFFHRSGNDHRSLLRRSRALMAVTSVALCLTVFLWSRSLFGTTGAGISLLLCAFSPLIISQGPLATSDLSASLFFTLAAWSWWRLLHVLSLPRLIACSASFAGLALTKHSAALMLPIAALAAVVSLLGRRETEISLGRRPRATVRSATGRASVIAGAAALCLLIVWGAVWSAYGWRFSPYPAGAAGSFQEYFRPGISLGTVESLAAHAGGPGRVVAALERHHLLPESYLYGMAYSFAMMKRPAFFNGAVSMDGWKGFFPYCFLVKSTLPLLVLFVAAALRFLNSAVRRSVPSAGVRNRAAASCDSSPLWILLGVYGVTLVFSSLNIGVRHMLPVYPAVFVLSGALALPGSRHTFRWAVALLLAWHVVEGFRAYPHYLAYFNQITGRKQAYRHLVDSNLDWGQDLPGLKAWLDRRAALGPPARVYLSYFGAGSPSAEGILAEPLEFDRRAERGLDPIGGSGIYCVSATNLQAVYLPIPGRWQQRYEQAYQEARREVEGFAHLEGPALQELSELRRRYRRLGTARLLAYLRQREPDAWIGYSILVFELTAADVARALDGPPPELAFSKPAGG